jgi:hypothetical protein
MKESIDFIDFSIIPMYCFNFNNSKQKVKGPAALKFFCIFVQIMIEENVILVDKDDQQLD